MEKRATAQASSKPENTRRPKHSGKRVDNARDQKAAREQNKHPENPDQQGQTANTKQNTTHQGYRQAR